MSDFCTGCGEPFAAEDDRFCAKCGKPRVEGAAPALTPTPVAAASEASEVRAASPASAASAASEASATSDEGKTPNKAGGIIAVALLTFVLPLVLIFALGDCGSAEGSMSVSGGSRGSWTFTPTGCASMQPYGHMGANLHAQGPNDGAVYVTLDHVQGQKVELEVPGSCRNPDGTNCTVFEVPRASCTTFDVDLDYTGTTVNDVRLVEGHVTLDCALEDGAAVRGSIVFDGC